jgi:pSer/pThr/pTyr-binding forkhead associated (FHA) protein
MSDSPLLPEAETRRPCLVVVSGVGIGRVFPLKERTAIGRAPEGDVVLPHPTVSWHHAIVKWRRGTITVRDLGSRNGTLVGVDKIKSRELVEGDVLAIGGAMALKLVQLSERAVASATVAEQENRDPVTGMANAASLLDRLRVELSITQENDLPMILTFFRVDGLSHLAEDSLVEEAMRKVARAIHDAMTCEGMLARSADGEFLALTRTLVSLAREMADNARIKVGRRLLPWGRLPCTLAGAVVPTLPTASLSADEILTSAGEKAQTALSRIANAIVVLEPVGALALGAPEVW